MTREQLNTFVDYHIQLLCLESYKYEIEQNLGSSDIADIKLITRGMKEYFFGINSVSDRYFREKIEEIKVG